MRKNMFGDHYCTNAEEVRFAMEERDRDPEDCYADVEYDPTDGHWIAEIKDNGPGDTVCYVEGFDSRDALRSMLVNSVGLPGPSVNYI